jgi:hypothetical protein
MHYFDRVYGEQEITEPLVLELIESPVLTRLKDIDSAGYSKPYYGVKYHSRFEHSVGVFLLLRKFEAPFKEQIAGLVHDVSHSAFSHSIDYILEEGSGSGQVHQDNIFEEYVRRSEIPESFQKYKIDLDYILDDENFPLKERELPDLCADRIDYSLRSAVDFKSITPQAVKELLDNLTTIDNQWVYKDFASAKKHADLFLKLNQNYYAGFPTAVMYRTLGDYLKYAMEQGYISRDDLYTTDKIVLEKIRPHLGADEKLKFLFERLNRGVPVKNDSKNYDAVVFCKSRIIDPPCLDNGKIKKLSELEPEWGRVVQKELLPKQYFLKFG